MTKANELTKEEERAVYAVGRKIEQARLARRLSIREAADRAVTTSRLRRGMAEATWRRVEVGYTSISLNGKSVKKLYRAKGETIMAMAEVVGLDGEALCKELGVTAPPARVPARTQASDLDEIKLLLQEVAAKVARLEQQQ